MSLQQTGTDTLDAQQLLSALSALKEGDFSQRLPGGQGDLGREIAHTFNTLLDRLNAFASEMNRITWEVGVGKFGGQAQVVALSGTWKELIDNLNVMSEILTCQVRNIAQVAHGIANGDCSRRVQVNAHGETAELKEIVNALVDQLNGRQSQHSPGR